MTSELTAIIIGVITALITSAIPAVLTYRATTKRLTVERNSVVSEASVKLAEATKTQIDNMLGTVDRLEDEVKQLRNDLRKQKARTTRLVALVKELNSGALKLVEQLEIMEIEPTWLPPEMDDVI